MESVGVSDSPGPKAADQLPLVEAERVVALAEGADAIERAVAGSKLPAGGVLDDILLRLATYIEKAEASGDLAPLADVAASLQEAIVDVLVDKTMNAVEDTGVKVVGGGGGVLANRRLREKLAERCADRGVELYLPTPELCTDNAAMIASAGTNLLRRGQRDGLNLTSFSRVPLSETPWARSRTD